MNFVALLFLTCTSVHSGFSLDPAGNSSSLSESNRASEEPETCPTNSSISVNVFLDIQSEWLTTLVARNELRNLSRSFDFHRQKEVMECNGSKYISIGGFLIEKNADNFSEVYEGEHGNSSGGENNVSCRGSIDRQTNADVSDRIQNTESKLVSMEETINKLILTMENATRYWNIDSKTFADISDRIENFERKLVSIEETINKLIFTKKNVTRNGKINDTINFAFDATFRGKKIDISADQRTASRLRPRGDLGYYGGVISNNPLKDDVAFEIRIDATIDKWRNEGIALGVIVDKNEEVKEKYSICYIVGGTYGIVSYYDANEGKSHIYKDGNRTSWNAYNMDTRYLPVGTTLGIIRRSNGAIHFLMNGKDMGAAFYNVPAGIYAFVDVIHYVSKISIIS